MQLNGWYLVAIILEVHNYIWSKDWTRWSYVVVNILNYNCPFYIFKRIFLTYDNGRVY